jgi:hypothetical protein
VVGQSYIVRLSVTVQNLGMFDEQFTFAVRANTTLVTQQTVSLSMRQSTTLMIIWNTTGFAKGNYTLGATTAAVPDEADTTDNTLCHWVVVTIPGDVKGDFVVDILDAILLSNAFNSYPGQPNWNPNADIKDDNVVDILDAIILSTHYGQVA